MLRHRLLALLALSTAVVVPAFVACSSSDSNGTTSGDAGSDSGFDSADQTNDAFAGQILDAGPPDASQCLLYPTEDDPVGLCMQKEVILGMHGQLTQAGLPAAWSVDTLLPVTGDGGATLHDMKDDVAYGASLSAYAASAKAYQDTSINTPVSADLATVAQLVESELGTLPSDYDGALYLLLRRFAAGLRAAGLTTHATNIDTLALNYGKAIYTNWFHPLAAAAAVPADAGSDAGNDDAGNDGGTPATDAGSADAGGAIVDGVLGTPSGSGFAYSADKEAAGALALIELATRATNGTLLPTGADAAAPSDTADALAWSQAGAAVFHHLTTRARAASGLYLTQLVTSSDPVHDAVTDDGSFSSETQGAVVLSYAHMANLLTATPEAALAAKDAANAGVAVLAVMQQVGNLWNPIATLATLPACNASSSSCGGGYFLSLDSTGTILDYRESSIANARLFAALQRLKQVLAVPQATDLVSLTALFTGPAMSGNFFGILTNQSAMVEDVTAEIRLTAFADGGALDGGPGAPMARDYTAQATNEVVEAMNAQWLGHPTGAPAFFQ